jgi:hypothetical protein
MRKKKSVATLFATKQKTQLQRYLQLHKKLVPLATEIF